MRTRIRGRCKALLEPGIFRTYSDRSCPTFDPESISPRQAKQVKNSEKEQELHAELQRLKAESERLIREHERLVEKFIRVHRQADKLHHKKKRGRE